MRSLVKISINACDLNLNLSLPLSSTFRLTDSHKISPHYKGAYFPAQDFNFIKAGSVNKHLQKNPRLLLIKRNKNSRKNLCKNTNKRLWKKPEFCIQFSFNSRNYKIVYLLNSFVFKRHFSPPPTEGHISPIQ